MCSPKGLPVVGRCSGCWRFRRATALVAELARRWWSRGPSPGQPCRPALSRLLRGWAVNSPVPTPVVLRESCRRQLAALLERLRAAEDPTVIADRCAMDLAGAFEQLHEVHKVDEVGRCSACWSACAAWPWPSRSECLIDAVLSQCLRSAEQAATPPAVPSGM